MFDPFRDVTEGPVHVLSMADNGNSASSCAMTDNDLFFSEVVGYSTDNYSGVDHGISDTYVGSGWARSIRPYCLFSPK